MAGTAGTDNPSPDMDVAGWCLHGKGYTTSGSDIARLRCTRYSFDATFTRSLVVLAQRPGRPDVDDE